MALRRKQKREIPHVGPFPPGWEVPASFNFTRDVVEAWASDPVRSALTFVDNEGIVDRRTFAEVAQDAARWAHLLRTRLDRSDRVMIVVGNVPAWHGVMLGAIKGGLVAIPCPNTLLASDLAFRVRHSGARLVIADRACEDEIEGMRNQIGDAVPILYLDEARAELSRYRPVAPTEETTAGESALILYTSGTTKEAKGVVHTHGYTWAQRMQATHWLDAQERDVVWCTAPPGSAKAIWNVLLGPWSHGSEVVLHESPFDPEERLSLVQRLGVTVLCQSPSEYRMLAKLDNLATTYLPRLRHAVSAGEPLNPEVITRFQDSLGLTVRDGYGQTENALLVANAPGVPVKPGSMGLPTTGHDVSIIDEQGNICAPGVEGEIALIGRPPTLFSGYWNDQAETNAVFRDGWYLSGDRAMSDEEGYIWFVGRADDVILSSEYRIGPFEVESALLEHPAVLESAAVGVPDTQRGQIVKAFVVLADGHEPSESLAVDLQDHVKAVTAPYKYPRAISFVSELPKTTNGKIRRSDLRELGDSIETFLPTPSASVVVPLHAVPDPEAAEAVATEPETDAAALRELELAEQARAAAAEAERVRVEAEAAARRVAEEAERYRARADAEEQARREAEEVERLRVEAEEHARREAEEAERMRAEAEASERARAEAEAAEHARREAEEAERLRIEAEAAEHARREAEAERMRAEAEAAERARADAEAAEHARREAEQAERLRAEIEAAEQAGREAEEAERMRVEAEAEAAEHARREAEEAERIRAEAEAAERARIEAEAAEHARREAEEQARRDAEERARREQEEAERLRVEAETAARARSLAETEAAETALEVGETESESESRRDARRRKKEDAARQKAEAEEAKRRAKEEAEQRKRDEAEAKIAEKRRAEAEKAAAKQREIDEKAAAKQREVDEKRRQAEEKIAAQQFAEDEKRRAKEAEEQRKRDEIASREAAKQREADERAATKRAAEAEKRKHQLEKPRRGLGRLVPGDTTVDDYGTDSGDDTAPSEPVHNLVERLSQYSGKPEGEEPIDDEEEAEADHDVEAEVAAPAPPPIIHIADASELEDAIFPRAVDPVNANHADGDGALESEQLDGHRSAP